MRQNKLKGCIFAMLAGLLWSVSGAAGQYLFSVAKVNPGWLTVIRLILSGLLLLAMAETRERGRLRQILKNRQDLIRLAAFSVFGLMMVQYSYMKAIACSNAGTTTAIQYSGEAMVLIVLCIEKKRLPLLPELAGLVLMLTGITLISTHGDLTTLALTPQAFFWCILSAVSLMLYTVLPGTIMKKYGNPGIAGSGMLLGGLLLACLLRFPGPAAPLTLPAVLCAAVIILLGTVVAFTVFFQSVLEIGPARAGMLSSIETIASPLLVALWLHTKFTLWDDIGFVCMLLMVWMLSVPGLKAQKKTE